MALTQRSALGALVGLAALVSTCGNPNFETRDIANPPFVAQKFTHGRGYDGSGKVYVISYALAAGALAGLAYNAMTGKLRR